MKAAATSNGIRRYTVTSVNGLCPKSLKPSMLSLLVLSFTSQEVDFQSANNVTSTTPGTDATHYLIVFVDIS